MGSQLCSALVSILLVLTIAQEGGTTQVCTCPSNGCSQSPSTGSCQARGTRAVSYQSTYYILEYYYQGYSYSCSWGWGSRCYSSRLRSRQVQRQSTYYRTQYYCTLQCCSGYRQVGQACTPVCSPSCANGGTCVSPNTCACQSEWRGPTCDQRTVSPASGSLGGGTILSLYHDDVYEMNSVDPSSVAVDIDGIPCDVLSGSSTTSTRPLRCTTRAYPSAEEGFDSPPLAVTVTLGNTEYQLTADFTYSWSNTPQIHYLDPPAIPFGHMLGFTGINLPTDPRDIDAVFIGEEPCDLIDTSNNEPYGTYTQEGTNSFLWIRCLPRQVTPGVYNMSVVVSNGTEGKAWRHSNSKYYGPGGRLIMLEVFPDIHSVQPSASHPHGGELITIAGVGLNCGVAVDVDGVPCRVIHSNFSEIKCVTGATPEDHPAVSEDGTYPTVQEGYRFKGGRGVSSRVFENVGSSTYLTQLFNDPDYLDNPDHYLIYPSYQPERNERYDWSGELSRAFFTPQETTTYQLWVQSDDEGQLFFGTSANINSITMIASVTHWNMYTFGTMLEDDSYLKYDTQRADPMELVAGETYLLIAVTKEGGGNDYIRVLALLPNSKYTKNESGWVIQDEPGWPNGYFMRPLPGFMLQTVEETPQVHLRVNGLLASCLQGKPLYSANPTPYNGCSFVYRHTRPRITRTCPNTWELSWNISILKNVAIGQYAITLQAEGSQRTFSVTGNSEQVEGLTVTLPNLSMETEYTATITGTTMNGAVSDNVVFYTETCNKLLAVVDGYTHSSTLTCGDSVPLGTQLILVCQVVGLPYGAPLNYTWTCPNGPCEVEGYYGRTIYSNHILAINTTSTSDGGTYTCQVTATGGQEASGSFTFSVTGGLVVHSYGRLIPFELPITDQQHISGPDGIGRITCTDSTGPAQFLTPSGSLNTGGVSQTPNGTAATLVVNPTGVGNFENRDAYCNDVGVSYTYLFLSDHDPFSIPRLTVNSVTSSDIEYRAERSDTVTERVINGYDVFRFGVIMTGVYVNVQFEGTVPISPVLPGAQYRIRAWAIGGVASPSNRRSDAPAVEYATTGEARSSAPRMLTITRMLEEILELNWLPPAEPNGEVQYIIFITPEDGTERSIYTGSKLTHFNLTRVERNQVYTNIAVQAVNSAGRSDRSVVIARYNHTPPDVDECASANGGCEQVCNSAVGSYYCSCHSGYRLDVDDHRCHDVDECTTGNGGCAHTCNNSAGSYHCSCDPGYMLDDEGRRCYDIDECAANTTVCDQDCSNTDSSFECSCEDGYRLHSDGRNCEDIDECAEDDHVCAHNCHNSVGSHSCSCNAGYRLNPDGRNCDDINECVEGTAGCNQRCMNTPGNYTCACYHGYTLSTANRHICVDIDECTTGNGGCGHNCNNTIGSYNCYCRTGYILDSDSRTCNDIDECLEDTDGCDQICTNTDGSFECSCRDGFRLGSDERSCEDVNECFIDADGCEHNCHNTEGAHHCSCNEGYMLNPDGRNCDDINECSLDIDLCNQLCVNTPGAYTCACDVGYSLSTADQHTCHDIDECTTGNGGCHHNCNNTDGSYHCYCRTGYTLDGDGRSCDDVNECVENTDGCDQECTNTDGSFWCSCRDGFRLGSDGKTCDDIDECAEDDHVCAHNCHNSAGSHSCSCNAGYRLNPDGRNCDDINECVEGTAGCNQRCMNTPGNYTCACYHGYTLSTANRHICVDIDECTTGNGGCGHNCNNTIGSYNCYCRTGYILDSDSWTCNDIDECLEDTDGCDQICTNTDGSFECSCRDGFRLGSDERSCEDVNECFIDADGCEHNCHNTEGAHHCSCNGGYMLNPDGRNCDDINECSLDIDLCNQLCVNTPGAYTCACDLGYSLSTADQHTCHDIDECTTGNGGCHHNCNNTDGSYHCYCRTGYTLDGDGRSCDDVDECVENTDGCDQECTNTDGSFWCSCRDGFRLGSDGKTCDDIDECAEDDHVCAHNCHNSVGSYSCSCYAGYRLNPDGRNCDDINECVEGTAGCNQRCMNTPGNYTCDCYHGYTLSTANRHICVDVNECTTGNGGCGHTCNNTIGSYHCSCDPGYRLGDNRHRCHNIDECAENTDGCDQICTDTDGSFECSCRDGFRLGSDGKSCGDIDECTTNNGGCEHKCSNTLGSFYCSCTTGYYLIWDARRCEEFMENATVVVPVNPKLEDFGDIRCNDSDCVISILLQLVGCFLDTDGDGVGDYTDDGDTFSTFFDPEKSISITDILKAILNGNRNDIVLPFNPIVSRYSFTRSTLVSICVLLPIVEQEVIYPGILWLNDITITVEVVGIVDPQISQIRQQGTGQVGNIVFDEAVVSTSGDRWYIECSRPRGLPNLPLTNVIDIFSPQAVFSTPVDISAWAVDVENVFAVFDFSQLTLSINIHGTLHISSWHSVSVCVVSQLSLNPQKMMDNRLAIVTDCNNDETGSFSLGEVLSNVAQVDIGPVSQLNNWNLGNFRLLFTGASSFELDEETAALLQFHVSCTSVLAEVTGSAILVDLPFTPPHSSFDPSLAGHCNMGRPFLIQIMEEDNDMKAHFVPVEYSKASYSSFQPHTISNITINDFLDALGIVDLGDAHSTLLGGGAFGLHSISSFTYLVSEMTIEVTSFISGTLVFAGGRIETHILSLITQASFTNEEVGKTIFLTGYFSLLKQHFDAVIDLDLEEDAYKFKGCNPLSVNDRALLAALGLPLHNEIALKFIGLFEFELHEPWITITSDSWVGDGVQEGETCIGGLLMPSSDNPFIGNATHSVCATSGDIKSSTAGWEIAGSSLIGLVELYTGEVVYQIPFLNARPRAVVVFSDTALPMSPLSGELLSDVNIMQGTFILVQMTYPTICTGMCQFVRQSQGESFHFQLSVGINIDFGVSLEGREFANMNSISSKELHELGAVAEVAMTFTLADFQFGAAWASSAEYRCVVVSDFRSSSNNAEVQFSVAIPLTLHFNAPQFELHGQVKLMFPEHQLVLRAAGDGCVRLSDTFSVCNIQLEYTVPTDGGQMPGFVCSAQPMLGSADCAAAGLLPYTAIVTINPTFVYVEIDQQLTVANIMEYFCVDTGKVSKVLREAVFPQGLVLSHGDDPVTVGDSNVNTDNGQLVRGTVDLFGVSAFAEIHLNLPTSSTLVAVMDPISMSRGFIKMTASRSDRYNGPLFYGSYDASVASNPVVAVNASGSINMLGQDVEAMLVVDDSHLKLALDAWIYQKVHVHIECEAGYGTPQNAAFSIIGHITDKSLGDIVDSIDRIYQQRSQYVTAVTKVALDRVAQTTETYSKATADHSTVEEYTRAVAQREREAFDELADVQYQIDQWCQADSICDECVAHEKCAKISFYYLLVTNNPCCLRKQFTICRTKAFECWSVRESIKASIRVAAAVWYSSVIQRSLAKTLLLQSATFKGEANKWLQVANDALSTVQDAIPEDFDFVSRTSKLLGDTFEGELSSVIDVKAIQWEVEMSVFKRLEFDVSVTAGFIDQTPKTCIGRVLLHEPASHVRAILCCLFDSFCEESQKKKPMRVKPKPIVLAELYRRSGNPFGERPALG